MPRGISKAKHPELYANAGSKAAATKPQSKLAKDMKVVASAGKKPMHWRTKAKLAAAQKPAHDDFTKLQLLQQHVAVLTSIKNANDIRDLLDEEIGDSVELLSEYRKKVFGEAPSAIQERQEQEAQRAQTQPVVTPPAQPTQETHQQPVFTPPQPQVATAPVPA